MKGKDFERGIWFENKAGDLILVDKKDGKSYYVQKKNIENQEEWEKRRQRCLEREAKQRKIEKSEEAAGSSLTLKG